MFRFSSTITAAVAQKIWFNITNLEMLLPASRLKTLRFNMSLVKLYYPTDYLNAFYLLQQNYLTWFLNLHVQISYFKLHIEVAERNVLQVCFNCLTFASLQCKQRQHVSTITTVTGQSNAGQCMVKLSENVSRHHADAVTFKSKAHAASMHGWHFATCNHQDTQFDQTKQIRKQNSENRQMGSTSGRLLHRLQFSQFGLNKTPLINTTRPILQEISGLLNIIK